MLQQFKNLSAMPLQSDEMPVLFMGHGSPMNGIEQNEFSTSWVDIASKFQKPTAIIVVSAHWFTKGTKVTAMDFPPTIHDFGGFPQALFDVQYNAPGNPTLAKEIANSVTLAHVEQDHDWGLDHGAWTVIRHMYPDASIPVLQLSIDYTKGPAYHYQLAKELASYRKKGVLILGSGNMVHNLRLMSWEMINGGGYDWALTANEKFKKAILEGKHEVLINVQNMGSDVQLGIPTLEHYLPLLYAVGLQHKNDEASIFNDKAVAGSLTMTSLVVGQY